MSRNLPALITTEIAKETVISFHLVEFLFDSGTIRFTTFPRNIIFNSETYISSPDFLSFGDVIESTDIEIGSMSFTLSGADQSVIAVALLEDFPDREINLYRGFLDQSTYQVIVDPVLIYEGRITGFKLSEDVDSSTSTLTWTTASIWADFNRTAGRRTNNNDQQVFYPGDLAFEYAHLITYDLMWGRT